MGEASYSSTYALADAGYQSVAASTRPPRPAPFTCSLLAHAAVLCWVIFGPSTSRERPKSLYEQVIAPNEKKLVWYSFNDKLPEVSPAARHAPSRPPRAEIKLRDQTIVATAPAAKPAKQMIWGPVPRVRLEQDLRAPNLIAVQLPYPAPPPDAAEAETVRAARRGQASGSQCRSAGSTGHRTGAQSALCCPEDAGYRRRARRQAGSKTVCPSSGEKKRTTGHTSAG